MKKLILFVCLGNENRSPTAEELYRDNDKYDVISCGISPAASRPVTKELVEWADRIIVMEGWHKNVLLERFPNSAHKPIINLNIPDIFPRGDARLVKLLKERLKEIGMVC